MLTTRVAVAALSVAMSVAACTASRLPQRPTDAPPGSQRMPDGKLWLTENLAVDVGESFCYGDGERGCNRYGRLYTWRSASEACRSLPGGWRLPTDDDWRQLASHFGGAFDNSPGSGKTAYEALLIGGASTFAAQLGGGRAPDGTYDDADAHGFYWTASEVDANTAPFYNFARGGLTLYRQLDGEKGYAFAVRCVRS